MQQQPKKKCRNKDEIEEVDRSDVDGRHLGKEKDRERQSVVSLGRQRIKALRVDEQTLDKAVDRIWAVCTPLLKVQF